jgi:hypothetical protein
MRGYQDFLQKASTLLPGAATSVALGGEGVDPGDSVELASISTRGVWVLGRLTVAVRDFPSAFYVWTTLDGVNIDSHQFAVGMVGGYPELVGSLWKRVLSDCDIPMEVCVCSPMLSFSGSLIVSVRNDNDSASRITFGVMLVYNELELQP